MANATTWVSMLLLRCYTWFFKHKQCIHTCMNGNVDLDPTWDVRETKLFAVLESDMLYIPAKHSKVAWWHPNTGCFTRTSECPFKRPSNWLRLYRRRSCLTMHVWLQSNHILHTLLYSVDILGYTIRFVASNSTTSFTIEQRRRGIT